LNERGETLFEYKLHKVEQRILELESIVKRLRKTLEKLQLGKPQIKVALVTRQKMLASSSTAQAVDVTDLRTGLTITYPSARRVAEALNASNSTIMNKLNGKHTKPYKGVYLIEASDKR
jgi:transcriptional regulator of aromatic amino acid metabolism